MSFYLFPGQGSQTPGMGLSLYENAPEAKAVFDIAEQIAPTGFLETLFHGDSDAVNHTRTAQPGLLTASIAITRRLAAMGIQPTGCAGHSLGEISALVAAEVCSFEDALQFTLERARLMSENIPAGSMAAVMNFPPEQITPCLEDQVWIANFNSPQQTIISGELDALNATIEKLKEAGAKRVIPLKVSGPFHSGFMKPAAESFAKVLANVSFAPPRCSFVSSVTGQVERDPERIRDLLAQQLYSPIRWTDVMATVGPQDALEVGPGRVLKGLARRTPEAPSVQCVGTWDDIQALEDSAQ